MKAQLLTVFPSSELRLAKLWAKGLQRFWVDHPPVRLLSDGTTTEDELAEVADCCYGRYWTDAQCREELEKHLDKDINELAQKNFWVRNLYLPSIVCQADTLVWDDTDGLFLRRPDTWIDAIKNHPGALTSIWKPKYGIMGALNIWEQIDPDIAKAYARVAPVHGTHSAPRAMVIDALPKLASFHRKWMENPDTGGAVCEMGAWQGIASRHRPGLMLSSQNYQIDVLQLQLRPEMYHSCTEKYAGWFWNAFLDGYEKHIENPVDGFERCSWVGPTPPRPLGVVPTI